MRELLKIASCRHLGMVAIAIVLVLGSNAGSDFVVCAQRIDTSTGGATFVGPPPFPNVPGGVSHIDGRSGFGTQFINNVTTNVFPNPSSSFRTVGAAQLGS